MKKNSKSTFIPMLFIGFLFCLPLCGGCQKDTLAEDTNTVSLSEIADDPSYANLPLIGTKWNLVGFVDEKARSIQLVESGPRGQECDHCFWVIFKEDEKIEGFSSGNKSMGHYSMDREKTQHFSSFGFSVMTYAGETPDGYRFLDCMKKVNKFDMGSRGLSLYYDPTNYLLFKPIK